MHSDRYDPQNYGWHAICDREKGYAMPSVANLFKLATVFGVSAEDLYKEINTTAAQEVETKKASLRDENE